MEKRNCRRRKKCGDTKLEKWLDSKNIKPEEFGKMIFVSKQTVYQWIGQIYKPTQHFMSLIKEATKGAVKESDWLFVERRK